MADGLSLAASIIAVFDLSLKVIKYARDCKDAPAEQARLLKDVANVKNSVLSLQKHLKSARPNDPWMAEVQALNEPGGPMAICKVTLERLLDKLKPSDDKRKRKVLSRIGSSLVWPFKAGEVTSALATIERQQRIFKIAMECDANTLRRAIKADVEANQQLLRVLTSDMTETKTEVHEILERSRTETERKVLEWLSIMQPRKDHHDISSRRTPETGEWVRRTKEFREWTGDVAQSNVLWCSGIPGSGKTFIASLIIDYLFNLASQRQAKVAYIYCDYTSYEKEKDPQRNHANIVGALLGRFMASRKQLPPALIDVYQKGESLGDGLRLSGLEEILITFCNENITYVVIDALDESGHTGNRRLLLNFLTRLEATKARLFYTTRPDQKDIGRHLKSQPHILIEASESDIVDFLTQKIQERVEEEEEMEDLLSRDLKLEIISTLVKRAHGMFLLPSLQIRTVLDQFSEAKIREALTILPEGLDEQFEATLQRIRNQSTERRSLALKTLRWLGHASEVDLDIATLQHALGVDVGDTDLDHAKLTPLSLLRGSIVDLCLGLVTIHKDTSQIRLVHFTLHDFLYNPNSIWYTTSEQLLAETCLTYLLFDAFDAPPPADDESYREMLRIYPLYEIASQRWGIHVHRLCHHNLAYKVKDQVFRLVSTLWQRYRAVQGWYMSTYNIRENIDQQPLYSTPAHLGAEFGLPYLVGNAVEGGWDVNDKVVGGELHGWTVSHFAACNAIGDQCGSWLVEDIQKYGADLSSQVEETGATAMYYAILHGRNETVRALLAHNADPELLDCHGARSLHFAAEYGQELAAKYLLESGCEVSPQIGGTSATPLHIAIDEGRHEIVQMLLRYGANIETSDGIGERPLHIAARRGHLVMISLLLDRGASIGVENQYGETPLITVSGCTAEAQNDGKTVQLLLKHGAAVNHRTRSGDTALSYAARQGHLQTVKVLLDAGADILASNEDNDTALHAAAEGDHGSVVRTLLVSGAEANTKNNYGKTALHLAATNPDVSRMLLEFHAEVDSPTSLGETALHLCSREDSDDIDVLEILLEHGGNIEYSNVEGQTPLHYAARWGKINILRALISHGASLVARTSIGQWPLHLAVRADAAVTQLLIDQGGSIESKTYKGTSPLHVAAMGDMVDTAQCLIQNGAAVNAQDDDGCTALHIAACDDFTEIIQLLLHHNASVEPRRLNGTTPLHMAALNGCTKASQLLLEGAADPEAVTIDTFTALMSACQGGHAETAGLLIEWRVNINAYSTIDGSEGWTSLVLAAHFGHLETVVLLLEENIDTQNHLGSWTALHAAIKRQHIDIVRILLDSNAFDIEAKAIGMTPLQLCILNSDVGILDLLLEMGASVKTRADDGKTAICFAAWRDTNGAATIFKILKEAGADMLVKDNLKDTCLHAAAGLASPELLTILLENGADVNAAGNEGYRPLHYTVLKRTVENAQLLIEAGADVNATDDNGSTSLLFASEKGFEELCALFLDNGASMELATLCDGHTPLYKASMRTHAPVVKLLLETGANVNALDDGGASVLHQAVFQACQSDEVLKQDLKAERDDADERPENETKIEIAQSSDASAHGSVDERRLSVTQLTENTELQNEIDDEAVEAERARRITVLNLILSYGADPNSCANRQQDTALHEAAYASSAPVITTLLQAGADLMAVNSQGFTAFHIVIYTNTAAIECMIAMLKNSIYDLNDQAYHEQTSVTLTLAASLPPLDREQVFDFLLSHGADLEARESDGYTPLGVALLSPDPQRREEQVSFLLSKGADPNATELTGVFALLYCATNCPPSTLKLLLDFGADVNVRGNQGETALMIAVSSACGSETDTATVDAAVIASVNILLDAGADVNAQNGNCASALHMACYWGLELVVRSLLLRGANAESTDDCGATPMTIAAEKGWEGIMEALSETETTTSPK